MVCGIWDSCIVGLVRLVYSEFMISPGMAEDSEHGLIWPIDNISSYGIYEFCHCYVHHILTRQWTNQIATYRSIYVSSHLMLLTFRKQMFIHNNFYIWKSTRSLRLLTLKKHSYFLYVFHIFCVVSLALGQSHGCPSYIEITLSVWDMGPSPTHNKTQKNANHLFLWMYFVVPHVYEYAIDIMDST